MSADHVIISKPVREITDSLLDLVEKTYTSSFPKEERRDFSLVRKLLEEDRRFEMYALLRDGIYVGFITGWQFESFVYVEHFAIDESVRNGGIGAKAMRCQSMSASHYRTPFQRTARHESLGGLR